MQVQQKQVIDHAVAKETQEDQHFVWSRSILYVFFAAAIFAWMAFDFVAKNAFMKDKLSVEIINKDITPQAPPALPDVSGYTTENIEKMVHAPVWGRVVFENIDDYPEFSEFLEGDAPRHLRLLQRRINPKALVIESGHYTFSMLLQEVQKIDPEGKLIQKTSGGYMLRVPLGVLNGATLSISGKDTPELLLSKQANAFLVSSGDLFILRTTVKGWDETRNTRSKYIDKTDYRPFITGWGGGRLFIAGSRIESLGYLKGKSYGLSYSTCTACLKRNPFLPHPTGAIVENYLTDMYYGFYSYEAYDVAIVRNEFADNVIYAIDPHDRSRRLIIAENKTYGTHYKHGIIVSREVNDSWIFNNHSYNNKGSGIMIDRLSRNNIIANNLCENNEQDGLTYFESQDNTSWGNTFQNNERNGILVRNSWNIKSFNDNIMLNKGVAVEVYSTDLHGKELHRDFELDPFTMKADITVYGAKIKTSGPSVFKMDQTDFIDIANTQIWSATHLFPISFWYPKREILSNIEKPNTVVRVSMGFQSTDKINFPTKFE